MQRLHFLLQYLWFSLAGAIVCYSSCTLEKGRINQISKNWETKTLKNSWDTRDHYPDAIDTSRNIQSAVTKMSVGIEKLTSQARSLNTLLFIIDTCLQKNQRLQKHGNKQVPAKKSAFDRVHYMPRLSINVTKRRFKTGKKSLGHPSSQSA